MSTAIMIVLDGLGVGELPDAAEFGDAGSDTLGNLARAVGGLNLPNLGRLGLGNIIPVEGVPPVPHPAACYGRMAEASPGKDSTLGHWEIAGLVVDRPFPAFPDGFPAPVIARFEEAVGRKVLGNVAESGTEIIKRLGAEHVATGRPIVYTSADSVFQVACHEDVVSVEKLYRMCGIARRILDGPHRVGRVIARPFTGKPGSFTRTARRRDFSCPPPGPTLLDLVSGANQPVVAIGKIDDLFAGRGFTEHHHSVDNDECLDLTLRAMDAIPNGLVFTNLVQFDMDWGHRNDVPAFARGLAAFDTRLPEVLNQLRADDLVFITADHGNDPTTPSTDHSREHVPLLTFGPGFRAGIDLGTRPTFADLGRTAADFLGVKPTRNGTSFLKDIR